MLFIPTEEVQKIKTKKTSIAISNVRTLHHEGQLDLLLDEHSTSTFRVYQKHAGVVTWMWHFSKIDTRSFTVIEKMASTDEVWHQSSSLSMRTLSREAVSPRMVSVTVKTRTGVRNSIQVYAITHQTHLTLMNNANTS